LQRNENSAIFSPVTQRQITFLRHWTIFQNWECERVTERNRVTV
jgi:hypothetical protein